MNKPKEKPPAIAWGDPRSRTNHRNTGRIRRKIKVNGSFTFSLTIIERDHQSNLTGDIKLDGLTASTEHDSLFNMFSAVFPINKPAKLDRATVPITTNSTLLSVIMPCITSSGSPSTRWN